MITKRTENRWEFYVPKSFNAAELLPPELQKYTDDAYYFASLIIRKTSQGKADGSGFVSLHSKYLERVMSKRYCTKIINSLIQSGAIERRPYIAGVRSYGYRLHGRYLNDSHVRIRMTLPRLIRKLEQVSASAKIEKEKRMKPIHHTLESKQYDLNIDSDHASRILQALPADRNRFDIQGILVSHIEHGRHRLAVGKYGRVSNSITNLKRELRPALRTGGAHLAGVDIKCCQPSLLALIITKKVGTYYALGMDGGGLPAVPACPSVGLFRYACLSGGLWDLLVEAVGRVAGVEFDRLSGGARKAWVKKRFLTDVLAKRKASRAGAEYPSPVEDVFKDKFPEVWQFIRAVNKDGWEHANLIRLLQKFESWLVIEKICGRFLECHPDDFVVTLHDAVYTRRNRVQDLIEAFRSVFAELDFRMSLTVDWLELLPDSSAN